MVYHIGLRYTSLRGYVDLFCVEVRMFWFVWVGPISRLTVVVCGYMWDGLGCEGEHKQDGGPEKVTVRTCI